MQTPTKEDAQAENQGGRPAIAADLFIPAMAAAAAVYFLVSSAGLAWEARSTGVIVGGVLLTLCTLQFAKIATRILSGKARFSTGDLFVNNENNRKRVGLLISIVVFTLCLRWTGTVVGLWLVLAVGLLIMGVRNLRQIVAISTITSAAVFVLFIWIAQSRMPRGPLERFLLDAIARVGGGL